MLKSLKNILKRYIEEKKEYTLDVYEFDNDKEVTNYGIDAGIKSFTHPFLKNVEGYLINLVVSEDEKIIKSAQMILFCSNSTFKRETLKENFNQYSFLKEFCKELGFKVDEIVEYINPNTKTEDFLSKVRDFSEIAMLYYILKNKDGLILRDGLFYFPYSFPGERDFETIFSKFKAKFAAVSKSSKILKDYYFIKNLDKFINLNKKFYIPVDSQEYYSKKQIYFLKDFIVRFSKNPGSRELYHVQTYDNELIGKIKIQKNYNYPLALFIADKYSRLSDNEIKNLELKILDLNYAELKELYFNTFKYQRQNWRKEYEN